ncbi:hypothetical protein KAR91_24350 [Candidatus Pacearchaeota archaeon]|nr:hypothetical protein [Candidatus Pacearchaeota archaeon]
MDNEKLIAQQALKIAEMEEEIKAFKEANKEIYGIIFCIGGPLNDNKLGYTHSQMGPFSEIADLIGR